MGNEVWEINVSGWSVSLKFRTRTDTLRSPTSLTGVSRSGREGTPPSDTTPVRQVLTGRSVSLIREVRFPKDLPSVPPLEVWEGLT